MLTRTVGSRQRPDAEFASSGSATWEVTWYFIMKVVAVGLAGHGDSF